VEILSAQFNTKSIPTYQNATSCSVVAFQDVAALQLIVKVTNIGTLPLVIDATQLKEERCTATLSYPTFFKIHVSDSTKTRSEKCIGDTIAPQDYTCSSSSSMGLSPGNYFVSTLWMDVSQTTLVSGTAYPVVVDVLPKNTLLTSSSTPVSIIYSTSRRRNLRERRSSSSSYLSFDRK
jgi:hypothetical protein